MNIKLRKKVQSIHRKRIIARQKLKMNSRRHNQFLNENYHLASMPID